MSEEHTWPVWMHPFLPKFEFPIKDLAYIALYPPTKTAVRKSRSRQGHVYSETFKVVCRRCNNGWMGDIEAAAKPVLIPLVCGQRTSLFKNARRTLAKWVTLKAMVIDSAHATDAVISESERDAFFRNRTIPATFRIWIFHHNCQKWYGGLQHIPLRAIDHSQNRKFAPGNNLETTTIGFGHLLVYIFNSLHSHINFNPGAKRRSLRLWPLRSDAIAWPPMMLSDAEVDRVGNAIKEFILATMIDTNS
jgi:hypothetical protein